MCLDMMEFDGKDGIMQKIAKNGNMFQKLLQYMQMALTFAQMAQPDMVEVIAQDIMQTMNGGGAIPVAGGNPQMMQSDHIAGLRSGEPTIVKNAKNRASNASQPSGGNVVARKER
jgi:hypothetical protein